MVSSRSLILACALTLTLALALALPTPQEPSDSDCPYTITPQDLTLIDPATASCSTTGDFASECADASRAAPAITASFEKYNIDTPGAQAALIAIMLFESGSFKYNRNHFPAPGRPGQGTRNMQMYPFNEKYATELFGAEKVAAAGTEDAVLALVQGDAESFGSAAWFLSTQCGGEIKEGLASGTSVGWEAYLTQCVGTTHTPDRDVSWTKAKEVLGA